MITNNRPKKSGNKSEKNEDRRSRRTKQLLKKASIELILESGFENVRVQDIIERADVGRTSFYAHFKNKEDLLLQNLDDLEEMFESDEENAEAGHFSLMMFRHLNENWRLAKGLMGNKRIPVVRNHVQKIITNYYKRRYREEFPQSASDLEVEAAAIVAAGALVSLTLWWLSMKKPITPEEMHTMFRKSLQILAL